MQGPAHNCSMFPPTPKPKVLSPPSNIQEFVNPSQFFHGNINIEPLTAEVADPGLEVEFGMDDLECGVQESNLPRESVYTQSVGLNSGSNQNAVVEYGQGTEQNWSTGNRQEKTRIGKNYFNVRGKTTPTLAAASLGKHFDVNHQPSVEFTMVTIEKFKSDCIQFVKGRLREWMVNRAIYNQVMTPTGRLITNFTELGTAYRHDSSVDMHRKMHDICYKAFLERPTWASDLEKEFMQGRNIEYHQETNNGNKTGCIQRLFTHKKSCLVSLLMGRTRGTHNSFVRLRSVYNTAPGDYATKFKGRSFKQSQVEFDTSMIFRWDQENTLERDGQPSKNEGKVTIRKGDLERLRAKEREVDILRSQLEQYKSTNEAGIQQDPAKLGDIIKNVTDDGFNKTVRRFVMTEFVCEVQTPKNL